MHTLADLAHTLHRNLEPFFPKMLPEFEQNFKEAHSYDILLDTLLVMKRLFRSKGTSHGAASFISSGKQIVDIVLAALKHEYSKIISEGLRVASAFVFVLRTSDGSTIDPKNGSLATALFEGIREKLLKTDIDQEVKQCAIIATASFVTVGHQLLKPDQISEILGIFSDRLQNDLTRDASLKGLTKIALNEGAPTAAPIPLSNLPTLLPRLFELLHKAQRSLHLNTLETLVALTHKYGD